MSWTAPVLFWCNIFFRAILIPALFQCTLNVKICKNVVCDNRNVLFPTIILITDIGGFSTIQSWQSAHFILQNCTIFWKLDKVMLKFLWKNYYTFVTFIYILYLLSLIRINWRPNNEKNFGEWWPNWCWKFNPCLNKF